MRGDSGSEELFHSQELRTVAFGSGNSLCKKNNIHDFVAKNSHTLIIQ